MILTEKNNGILKVTLNFPQKMNCMGFEMLIGLQKAVQQAKVDEEIKLLLITGAGERAFSSGANIKEFQALTGEKVKEWIRLGNEVNNEIEALSMPTVALVNGYAMGGGLELALACDFRLATPNALLASPEVKNGWLPGWGGMTRLRNLFGEPLAKRLVLGSEYVDAQEAYRLGLVTKIVEEQEQTDAFLNGLLEIKGATYSIAKSALQNPHRRTDGVDVIFDVLAVQIANES
ncbi:enoyl-CoA hydratase/isomerase family protein [Persicobacter diffluens]